MNVARNAVIGAGALVAVLGLVGPARALTTVTVDPCLAAEKEIVLVCFERAQSGERVRTCCAAHEAGSRPTADNASMNGRSGSGSHPSHWATTGQ